MARTLSILSAVARCWTLVALATVLSGCEGGRLGVGSDPFESSRPGPRPAPTPIKRCGPGQAYIGFVDAEGPNAFVNGRNARDGDQVCENDTLSTGPASSIRVYLGDDTQSDYIQLNANTDPRFRRAQASRCVLVDNLNRGDIYADNVRRNACIVFNTNAMLFMQQSAQTNIRLAGPRTELTVVRGTLSPLRIDPRVLDRASRPELERQTANQATANSRVVLMGGREVQRVQIPPNEVDTTTRWRLGFPKLQKPPPQPPR